MKLKKSLLFATLLASSALAENVLVQPVDEVALNTNSAQVAPVIDPDAIIKAEEEKVLSADPAKQMEREQRFKSALQLEKYKTELLKERQAQREIVAPTPKNIDAETAKKMGVDVADSNAIADKAEENTVATPDAPQNLGDTIQVTSVYGLSDHLFVVLQVNGYKYNVSKGETFGDGYTVKEINKYGVKLSKDGQEDRFYNVSAPTEVQAVAPVATPNVVYPAELPH